MCHINQFWVGFGFYVGCIVLQQNRMVNTILGLFPQIFFITKHCPYKSTRHNLLTKRISFSLTHFTNKASGSQLTFGLLVLICSSTILPSSDHDCRLLPAGQLLGFINRWVLGAVTASQPLHQISAVRLIFFSI